jgi:potassium-transporting ATPase KdpC subunit
VFEIISGALRASLVTFVFCGLIYPLALTGLGQWLMPFQANGSMIVGAGDARVGSLLIGQEWRDAKWFHGRPSATMATDSDDPSKTRPAPYNAMNSGASNLGPISKELETRLLDAWKALDDAEPEATNAPLPADMVTTSASGLDPDISPANALLQSERVAKARGVAPGRVAALARRFVVPRSLGVFGEPRVNVLQLNIALEKEFPK